MSIAGKIAQVGAGALQAVKNNPGRAIAAGGAVGAASTANMLWGDAAQQPQVEDVGNGKRRITVSAEDPNAGDAIARLSAFGEGVDNGDGTMSFTLTAQQYARVMSAQAPTGQ